MFEQLTLLQARDSVVDAWVKAIKVEKYSLNDLCNECGVAVVNGKSEMSCTKVVEKLLGGGVECRTDEEIPLDNFKHIPVSVYSAWQKPDVAISYGGLLVIIVEVHSCTKSSSFANTIRKLILGLVDVIRYYSNYDQTVTSYKGLMVPKLSVETCVVEVTVEFRQLMFEYSLQEIRKDDFRQTLECVYKENWEKIKDIKLYHIEDFKYFIVLCTDVMKKSYGECRQVSTKESIMFQAGEYYYKVPYCRRDFQNLATYSLMSSANPAKFKNFIKMENIPNTPIFKYPAVWYDPLTPREAGWCLGELVPQIKEALDDLHDSGLHHCDIRLENICFERDFSLTFVDLDRCTLSSLLDDSQFYTDSCMYDLSLLRKRRIDWRQLACLILWVVTGKEEIGYHQQKLEGLDHPITSNCFFKSLWTDGM